MIGLPVELVYVVPNDLLLVTSTQVCPTPIETTVTVPVFPLTEVKPPLPAVVAKETDWLPILLVVIALPPETVTPDIVPPVIATALAFWVDIVPRVPVTLFTKAVVAMFVELSVEVTVGAVAVPVSVVVPETDKFPTSATPEAVKVPLTLNAPAEVVLAEKKLVPSPNTVAM